jgi:hypothetical protein
MQSSLIGKVEKAKQYAREPERITFHDFEVSFRGTNDCHTTGIKNSRWFCTCDFFAGWGTCCHTMALEKMFSQMLPSEAITNFECATQP